MWLVCVHTLHLQAMPSQFFMILSDVFKFSQDFMWGRREFQIFGPKDLMLLLPKLTWLTLGIHVCKVCMDYEPFYYSLLIGQVEDLEIAETTEITEIAAEQGNYKFWQ